MRKSALALPLGALSVTSSGQQVSASADRPGHAVLIGTPVRPLSDPASLVSRARGDARPLPLGDVVALRSSYFATWTPDGRDIIFAPTSRDASTSGAHPPPADSRNSCKNRMTRLDALLRTGDWFDRYLKNQPH
ncbi:MAG TPA: hypothetical protein VJ846_04550 [Sphingomicrobium sp.]|nr:hypothetical protein [Sphingomicrobium sp.]